MAKCPGAACGGAGLSKPSIRHLSLPAYLVILDVKKVARDGAPSCTVAISLFAIDRDRSHTSESSSDSSRMVSGF
jgi:hypothetical protein